MILRNLNRIRVHTIWNIDITSRSWEEGDFVVQATTKYHDLVIFERVGEGYQEQFHIH